AQIRDGMHDTDYATGVDLAGYWKMDDALCTTTAADSSGNANTGTVQVNLPEDDKRIWITSSAPMGVDGKFVATATPTSVGPPGGTLEVTITSIPGDSNNVALFQYGSITGATVDWEGLPAGFVSRSHIIWGVRERGAVTANLVFSYDGHPGIS